MDVDASLTVLGGFGWVQTVNFLVFAASAGTSAWHLTGVSFTIAEPDGYRCSLPPIGTGNSSDGGLVAKKCRLVYDGGDAGDNFTSTTPCLYGWEYDWMHGETSSVTDLDLVCDRALLAGTLTSIHFGGALVGSYILGQLSDIFGRRLIVFGSLIGIAITGTALSFTWNYGLMAALRFLNGCCIPGILAVGYVRMIEMFTPSTRLKGQVSGEMAWVVGILVLAPIAYILPEWRHLQLAISLIGIPLIPLVWFSFESIRWLVQKGKVDEAEKILQKIAKSKNISHCGYFLLDQRDPDLRNASKPAYKESIELKPKDPHAGSGSTEKVMGDSNSKPDMNSNQQLPNSEKKKKTTVLDLFKSPALIIRTLIIFYCWFVSSVVYYGFFINSANLVGNKYFNFFLISLTEAPCYILNYFIMTRFGRRRPLLFFYIASGVACVVTGAIPTEAADGSDLTVVILVTAMIGKFFASAAFDIIYLVTVEVYPTILRNAAVGAASVVGRVGGMVAPFIVYLNVVHNSIPMVVFGVVSLLAGVLAIPLPETSNRALPETLDDGVKLAKNGGTGDEVPPVDV